MGLTEFYKLRNNFILIGLTGRMRGGAHDVADLMKQSQNPFLTDEIDEEIEELRERNINEGLKYQNLKNYIGFNTNWKPFHIIKYRNVVLLHLLHSCQDPNIDNFIANIINFLLKLGKPNDVFKNERFGSSEASIFHLQNVLRPFLESSPSIDCLKTFDFTCETLNSCLENKEQSTLYNFYFGAAYEAFCSQFFKLLDTYSHVARIRMLHILAFYLRVYGKLDIDEIVEAERKDLKFDKDLSHIYTTAQTIKYLLKSCKSNCEDERCNIVIDSLKNSFEINYFRERFAGFYLVSVNKDEELRKKSLEQKLITIGIQEKLQKEFESCLQLDQVEYNTNDFKKGGFASPDIENCIQKSDYHIFIDKEKTKYIPIDKETSGFKINLSLTKQKVITKDPKEYKNEFGYKSMRLQLLKLICLIKQPGIITPSALERTMQVAYNAKLNSGCISRQVGAVVTDEFYSVKGIGWNEVPEGQTPCALRDIKDFSSGIVGSSSIYTKFEQSGRYKDISFIEKMKEAINSVPHEYLNQENGRNCPYCFKSFHNAFEGKDNQVHTRSLHAEENAMLQIAKYGGQSLKGGNLFTTASPCELCSKKAFQLGIKNIFYIDPYPGISQQQILKGGNSSKNNPKLYMYQGAIGRGYNKLYEPMMSIKDETILRTGIKPKESDQNKLKTIKTLLEEKLKDDKETIKSLDAFLVGGNALDIFADIIRKGIQNKTEDVDEAINKSTQTDIK